MNSEIELVQAFGLAFQAPENPSTQDRPQALPAEVGSKVELVDAILRHGNPDMRAFATLEEYKLINEQAQFVMTRYMQGLALYLTFVGFGINGVLETTLAIRALVILVALTCGNALAWYAANHFKRMAYHALDRQNDLAAQLGFKAPYPMIWGYRVGIVAFTGVQLGVVATAVRILWRSP